MSLSFPEFPIHAFIGPNGSSKTYCAVHMRAVPAFLQGREVCANLELDPTVVGASPDLFVPLESWRQVSTLRDSVLVLDEISSVLPSRQAQSVPADLLRRLNQLRKVGVSIVWTAPSWARCDVALREVTQGVTVCRSRVADRWQRVPGTAKLPWRPFGERVRWTEALKAEFGVENPRRPYVPSRVGWEPRAFFTWCTYDAREWDEFTFSKAAQVNPKNVMHHWRPSHSTERVYKTMEEVEMLDHLADTGVCLVCNGTRRRRSCECADGVFEAKGRRTTGPILTETDRRERAVG
jgi:hypothetical protein